MRSEASIETIKSYLAQRQWDKVIAICKQALDDNLNHIEIYHFWGKALVGLGKFDEAIDIYQKLLVSETERPDIYAEIGLLYSRQQQLVKAAWHYQQALALKPDWADLQYNLAVILHQLENWQQAISCYEKTIALKPEYASAYFNLGVLYDRRGELEKAVVNYHEVLKLQPNNTKTYSNLGSTLVKQEKYAAAIEVYQQGLKHDPTWAVLHNNLGQVLWLNKQPDKALARFETAIVLEPNMSLAHYNLGKLWQQQRNYSAAIECFQQVIKLEPNNIWAYSYCAEALFIQNNLELTIDYFQAAISIQPDFVKAYCQRAKLLRPESLLEQAKISCANFLTAIQNKLNYSQILAHFWKTYFYWGDVLFTYGGIKQAQVYYQKALQIKPDEVKLYLRLGNCLAKQGKLDEAIIIYQMGLSLAPNEPQICFQLGKILEQQQQVEQAINYYKTACQQEIEDSATNWEQLPDFFPSDEKLLELPQGIYSRTIDWVKDCNLEEFEYFHIDWLSEEMTAIPLSRKPIEVELTLQKQSESNGNNLSQQTQLFYSDTVAMQKSAQLSKLLNPKGGATKTSPSSSFKSKCGGVNCATCMGKLISYFEPVQIGKQTYKCLFSQPPPIDSPSPFVVKISAGRAWIAEQKNSWLICNAIAIITPDNYLLGDLSRYYPWYLPGCPEQERIDHTIFSLETIPSLEKIEGKVAVLSGLAGHVYYHWMVDIIPRIDILRRSGIDIETIDWFVVNNIERDFQKETLEFLGIPASKIIVSDRHSYIQAEDLIVPSFPGHLDWVPKSTITFLRKTFLPALSRNSESPKRIYISRSQARGRVVINEEKVIDVISQLGFQTVWLENLSVLEQVSLFANAEAIISPHGSSLTNLVFCSPGAVVIELFSPHYLRTDYWILSQQLQLQHYYSIGDSFDCFPLRNLMYQNSLTEDILVNINSLQKTLKVAGLTN